MLTYILMAAGALAAVVVLVLIVASLRSSTFQVSRSRTIAAPPAEVFPHLNNLRRTTAWNPWVKLDPHLQQTFEGPDEGVGAIYAWDGNKNVGAGRQTIVDSQPNQRVGIKLEFFRPFAGENDVQFALAPSGPQQTVVTWSMAGKLNFVMKVMGLFMSMDKMCGDSFDEGLASLAAIVEPAPTRPAATAHTH